MLYALSALFLVVASILLAHRNDLGWWALIVAIFAGPVIDALKYDLYSLIYAVPLLILAFWGLWRFSRFDLQGKFTRLVTRTSLTLWSTLGLVVGVVILVALHFGQFLLNSVFLSAAPSVWVMYVAEAAIFASFVLIARGVRAGWLVLAAASIANVVVYFMVSPMLGMLGLQVFTVLAAGYGWFLWRNLPEVALPEPTEEELALDSAAQAAIDKLNSSQAARKAQQD